MNHNRPTNWTFQLPHTIIFCLPPGGASTSILADAHLTNTHVKFVLAPIAFGMELLADVMIMLGTVFYLRKGRQGHSPSFRYVAVCIERSTPLYQTVL
jgi:hypothetical protein